MSSQPLLGLANSHTDLARIDAALRQSVRTGDDYMDQLASHLVLAGGKRLRPVISVVASQVDGRAEAPDEAVLGGVACELVQVGSLYHDDVMDEALTRRGVETVNAKWGNLQAIVAGDFLLARASEIAASLGTEVAGLLARTIGRLCFGQVGELRTTYDVDRSEAQYFGSIREKTAALFAAPARIGALTAGHEPAVVEAVTAWGEAYGMVFQLVDDILDLTATDEQLGKPAGHDMVEGVYTLAVIRALNSPGTTADALRDVLGKPLDAAGCATALSLVRGSGLIAEAYEAASGFVREASDALANLPDNAATRALRDAPGALLASV